RGRLAPAEAERGPEEERDAQKLEWVVLDVRRKQSSEHEQADPHEHHEQRDGFEQLLPSRPAKSRLCPEQQYGSEHQRAAQPDEPGEQPDGEEVLDGAWTRQSDNERLYRGA